MFSVYLLYMLKCVFRLKEKLMQQPVIGTHGVITDHIYCFTAEKR